MFDEILFAVAHNALDKGLSVPLYAIRSYDAANFSLLSFHMQPGLFTLRGRTFLGQLGLGIISFVLFSMLRVLKSLKVFYMLTHYKDQAKFLWAAVVTPVAHSSYAHPFFSIARFWYFCIIVWDIAGVKSQFGLLPCFYLLPVSLLLFVSM